MNAPLLIDLVLAVLVAEALLWWAIQRLTRRGLPFADVAGNLLAGLFLALAVREALAGAAGGWLAFWLAAAGAAHAFDMRRRWRQRAVPPDPSQRVQPHPELL